MRFPEYAGMSYEQASIAAENIIRRVGWYGGFERLQALRDIMERASPAVVAAAPHLEQFKRPFDSNKFQAGL